MPPKFTRNELEHIASALRDERRREDVDLSDEEMAAVILAPVRLSAEEEKFLAKKKNRPPTVADLIAGSAAQDQDKVVSANFAGADARGFRIAASKLERPRSGRVPESGEKSKVIATIHLGLKELGVDAVVYLNKVRRQLRLPQGGLDQMAMEDLERIDKRIGRDIDKSRPSAG